MIVLLFGSISLSRAGWWAVCCCLPPWPVVQVIASFAHYLDGFNLIFLLGFLRLVFFQTLITYFLAHCLQSYLLFLFHSLSPFVPPSSFNSIVAYFYPPKFYSFPFISTVSSSPPILSLSLSFFPTLLFASLPLFSFLSTLLIFLKLLLPFVIILRIAAC